MYDQGLEFIGHDIRKSLIETEYGITYKPSTLGNTMSNAVLELIQQVLGNLLQNYIINQTRVDEDYPWSGILSAAAFAILSTTNRLKGYILGQLVFGCDMIIPIKYTVYWEFIRHRKQTQINKDNIRKNRNRVYHNYKVVDKFILTKYTKIKYKTRYTVPFLITLCWTNSMVSLQYGTKGIRYSIRHINPYKSDTKVEYFSSKHICDDVNI